MKDCLIYSDITAYQYEALRQNRDLDIISF